MTRAIAYAGLACAVLYHNDRQIVERHGWRHDDKRNPRVEVEVRRATA